MTQDEKRRLLDLLIDTHSTQAPKAEHDAELHQHEERRDTNDHSRSTCDEIEVHRRADSNEEEPQQQTLERFNITLELVPVFAGREHDAGQKGPQRRA